MGKRGKMTKIKQSLEEYEESERDKVRTPEQERRYWAIVFIGLFVLIIVFVYFLITARLGLPFSSSVLIDFLPLCITMSGAITFAAWVIVKQAESNRRRIGTKLTKGQTRRLNICLYIDMALILGIIYLFWKVMVYYGG